METWKGVVSPAQCDILEHMNLQYYFAAVGEGMFAFQTHLGLGPTAVKAQRMSFAVVHAQSNYRAELVAGDVITLYSGVEKIGSKSITFYHRLDRVEDGRIAFDVHFKAVLFDLEARQALEIPAEIKSSAELYLVDPAESVVQKPSN